MTSLYCLVTVSRIDCTGNRLRGTTLRTNGINYCCYLMIRAIICLGRNYIENELITLQVLSLKN